MKWLLFSDLHLKPESEDVCFAVLAAVREEYERLLQEDSSTTVGFLGDFFHLRYAVPVHLLNRLYAELKQWHTRGLRLVFLPGNHDQIDIHGRNALEILEAFDNVDVITQPRIIQDVLWLPYRKDVNEIYSWVQKAREVNKPYVFAHLPVAGAWMNNKLEDKDGIPAGMFRGFQRVILGHYHKRQQFAGDRICYVGSPWQTRADEYGQKKGWCLFDTAQNKLTYVDKVFGKRFHRVEGAVYPDIVKSLSQGGDQVTLVAQTEEQAEEWSEQFGDTVIVQVRNPEQVKPRLGLQKGSTLAEYARAWVARNKGDLDPNILMKTFEGLRT